MRTVLRYLNVAVAGVCLLSALIVLGSNVFDPVYRAASPDALWFVALYAVAQAAIIGAFLQNVWYVPWVGVGKTVVTYLFLALLLFVPAAKSWMSDGPSRYVYQFVDWGPGAEFILFGFLLVGRGVGNTLNALFLTEPWWRPWRRTQPLLSRLFTAVPVVIVCFLLWTFFGFVRAQWIRDVAQMVVDTLDCPTVQAKQGQTTTDVRQLGKQRFLVLIKYGCPQTSVVVQEQSIDGQAIAGRLGGVMGAERCCVKLPPEG